MTSSNRLAAGFAAALLGIWAIASCGPDFSQDGLGDSIPFEPARPVALGPAPAVERYAGSNESVAEAQRRFPDGLELHRKVIWRTCTPNGGVCHNQKEYPDLHTPQNFAAAVGAPCNVQPGQESSVYDGCERTGDRLLIDGRDFKGIEIGTVTYIPGEHTDWRDSEKKPGLESPGIHVTLHDPAPIDRDEIYATARFVRTFIRENKDVDDIAYAGFETRWWVLEGGSHLFGEVQRYQQDRITELLDVGVIQGDLNRNGVFGARESKPIAMIEPGDPLGSYLVARLRGQLHDNTPVPGSRMPLANKPLNIAEMLALFCFIEGLPGGGAGFDMAWPIDYANCSFSEDPENLNLLGEGVTWTRRVQKILTANCGGCHGGEEPDAGFDILSEGAYERLLEPSSQDPSLALIKPGDPENSYLWRKIARVGEYVGQAMPIDPLEGERQLTEAELGDIETWIVNGAVENE